MIIYVITNKITGKRYIGQTIDSLKNRWNQHQSKLSCCRYLKKAINKYGSENFETKILSRCNSIEEMNRRETYYIKLFKTLAPNGYNLNTGGNNRIPSDETRLLISIGNKGIKKPRSAEHAKKIGLAKKGAKQSTECKIKKANALFMPVRVPELGIVFPSYKEASNTLGTHNHVIRSVVKGYRENWKGLTFKRAKKDEITPISERSLILLSVFLKNKKNGHIGKKHTSNRVEANRLAHQKPIYSSEINMTFDSIKIASFVLGMSTSSIALSIKENRSSANGLSFIFIEKGEIKGLHFNSQEGNLVCEEIKKNKIQSKIEILCIETNKKYVSCTEAAKDIGSHSCMITRFFAGKIHSVKGFTFKKVS